MMSSPPVATADILSGTMHTLSYLLLDRRNTLLLSRIERSRCLRLTRLTKGPTSIIGTERSNTVSHVTVTTAECHETPSYLHGHSSIMILMLFVPDYPICLCLSLGQATDTVSLLHARRGERRYSHWPCRIIHYCMSRGAVPSGRA
jgi:hypothetical protein